MGERVWLKKRSRSSPDKSYWYNTHTKQSQWTPPFQYRIFHLLVKHKGSRRPSSWKQENITRTKEEAIEILKRHREAISSGNVDFVDLARSESDCSSSKRGGDLGMVAPGDMQEPFEDASFALKKGELSDIVESDSGVHIIWRPESDKYIP